MLPAAGTLSLWVNNEAGTHEAADTFNLDHLFYVQTPASL